jgi:hypothetical protein
MYRFEDGDDFLEFYIGDDSLQELNGEDTVVSIVFSINGFSGRGGVYILDTELKSFANEILQLEKKRKGRAKLISSIGDISFEMRSIDNLGSKFGIICKIVDYGYLGDEYITYEASAFMKIDANQLVEFSQERWISTYAR